MIDLSNYEIVYMYFVLQITETPSSCPMFMAFSFLLDRGRRMVMNEDIFPH